MIPQSGIYMHSLLLHSIKAGFCYKIKQLITSSKTRRVANIALKEKTGCRFDILIVIKLLHNCKPALNENIINFRQF